MTDDNLKMLIGKVLKYKFEFSDIEVKSARKGCPEKLYDTLSAFSNQDDGGTIIFGIDESENFEVCGVYDINDIQKRLTLQCKNMEPPVRALYNVIQIDGKDILVMEIPSVSYYERPCYYKGKGKYEGSYIRVGDADLKMTEFEIYSYESSKKRDFADNRVVSDEDLVLKDNDLINQFLTNVKTSKPNLSKNVSDEQILELSHIYKNNKPTLTGALLFSKDPQYYFPNLTIICLAYPFEDNSDVRFLDNLKTSGNISDMLEQSLNFVLKNIKKRTSFNQDLKRTDVYEYPPIAIREIILNALVHRDYSRYNDSKPIIIRIYNDHIEFTNPGGLFGDVKVTELGKVTPQSRNPHLTEALEVLKVCENRYSGIPTIKKSIAEYYLPEPIFNADRNVFQVILRNSFADDENGIKEKILAFCLKARTKDEISKLLNISKNYVMTKYVKPLLKENKLKLTIPNKPNSPFQKYIKV